MQPFEDEMSPAEENDWEEDEISGMFIRNV